MTEQKKRKEKPKYNIFQNTVYAFKNIWKNGQKGHVIAAAVKIPINFIVTVITLYTPVIILNRLEFSDNIQQIITVYFRLYFSISDFYLFQSRRIFRLCRKNKPI